MEFNLYSKAKCVIIGEDADYCSIRITKGVSSFGLKTSDVYSDVIRPALYFERLCVKATNQNLQKFGLISPKGREYVVNGVSVVVVSVDIIKISYVDSGYYTLIGKVLIGEEESIVDLSLLEAGQITKPIILRSIKKFVGIKIPFNGDLLEFTGDSLFFNTKYIIKGWLYFCMCMTVLFAYLCVHHVCAQSPQRPDDPLELGLQTVMKCYVGKN